MNSTDADLVKQLISVIVVCGAFLSTLATAFLMRYMQNKRKAFRVAGKYIFIFFLILEVLASGVLTVWAYTIEIKLIVWPMVLFIVMFLMFIIGIKYWIPSEKSFLEEYGPDKTF